MSRYAVFGNPVQHSRSPQIHEAFAAQRKLPLRYDRIEAPLDSFASAVRHFFGDDGAGANVTVPFKEQAFELCLTVSDRAREAGAVNTLSLKGGQLHGDNTDGVGLVQDIRENLGWQVAHKRVLVLGAGGAVRGILAPLLAQAPTEITIANRTLARAEALAEQFQGRGVPVHACSLDSVGQHYNLVINAISAGLHGDMPDLPATIIGTDTACYDMVYGKDLTPFLQWAELHGATATADGIGMLVEQAAESFYQWHNWRPKTGEVIEMLKRSL